MIGPRNTVIRTLMGEDVPLEDWLSDSSEFVDSDLMTWRDTPEMWVDRLYEGVYED